MPNKLMTWLGQVTTGHGMMVLGPTILAVLGGQLTWAAAMPLLATGVVGLLWPENAGLQAAVKDVSVDVEKTIAAYRTGMDHAGAAIGTPVKDVSVDVEKTIAAYRTGMDHAGAAIGTPVSVVTASKVAAAVAVSSVIACLVLSACAPGSVGAQAEAATLQAAGASPRVAQTIVVGANFGATLACQARNFIVAVPGVQVSQATAAAVAAACATISVDGVPVSGAVPVPAPLGAVLAVATVPQPVAAAVAASVPASPSATN